MAVNGTALLDFGSFPGSPEATIDVTGQAGLVATSKIEAWVLPVATADHSADEHKIENIRVIAFYKVDGTLTINGYVVPFPQQLLAIRDSEGGPVQERARLFGKFTIGWVWA
jgi:hypothetical protein